MDKLAVQDVKMDLSVSQIGSLFAKSGMFKDASGEAQALTKILAGRELGFPPFTSMSDLHVVQGKIQIGAHLIASRIRQSANYDFEIETLTDTECSIIFFERSKRSGKWMQSGKSTFTMADAKKAGLVKDGGNWAKTARNMLFARAISNGYKWYAPDLFESSVYYEGEFEEDTLRDVTPVVKEYDSDIHAEPQKAAKPEPPTMTDDEFQALKDEIDRIVTYCSDDLKTEWETNKKSKSPSIIKWIKEQAKARYLRKASMSTDDITEAVKNIAQQYGDESQEVLDFDEAVRSQNWQKAIEMAEEAYVFVKGQTKHEPDGPDIGDGDNMTIGN